MSEHTSRAGVCNRGRHTSYSSVNPIDQISSSGECISTYQSRHHPLTKWTLYYGLDSQTVRKLKVLPGPLIPVLSLCLICLSQYLPRSDGCHYPHVRVLQCWDLSLMTSCTSTFSSFSLYFDSRLHSWPFLSVVLTCLLPLKITHLYNVDHPSSYAEIRLEMKTDHTTLGGDTSPHREIVHKLYDFSTFLSSKAKKWRSRDLVKWQ